MTGDRTRRTRWVGAFLLALLLIIAAVVIARWSSAGRTTTSRTDIEDASGDDADRLTPEGVGGDSCAPTG
jgi:ABC-type transporter Mla subunit MlaD